MSSVHTALIGIDIGIPPAQGATRLGVVLVVVQPQKQLGQVRVDLVVSNTGQDLEEQERLPTKALETCYGYVT